MQVQGNICTKFWYGIAKQCCQGDIYMDINYYKKYEPFFGTWYFDGDKSQLGTGSFASVFRIVRHDANVNPCALKIITIPKSDAEIDTQRSEGMDDISIQKYYQHMVDDIRKEFELMSELKGCNNVASCEDFMAYRHKDGFGFDIMIRMELLLPLISYEMDNKIDEMTVIKLGIDMCQALERCIVKNIIHRDIKPDNIFISSMGDFKLGDFGIARTMDNTVMMMSRKGTPNYMAPEVYFSKPYDNTADIYSLGIVLYRMLNDRRIPFLPPAPKQINKEDREDAFMKRIKGVMLPRPAYGDEALKSIVLKACAYRREDRYQKPEEMRMHLEMVHRILMQGSSVPKEFAEGLDSTISLQSADLTSEMEQIIKNNLLSYEDITSVKKIKSYTFARKFILAVCVTVLILAASAATIWQFNARNTSINITTGSIKKAEKTNAPNKDVYDKKLDITELDAKKDGLESLSELEYYKNLKVLSLKDYGLKDTSKLSGLNKIISLDLSSNINLEDLSGISGMEALEKLDLSETAVSNIDVVQSLKSLKSINISYTLIEDASPLKGCTELEVLYAAYNNENFTNNSIMEAAGSFKNLKELDLTGNTIAAEGIGQIKKLSSLVLLKLGGTSISDIHCGYLKELKKLELLDLQSNINITDFKFITSFKKLKKLDLSATGITDINGIEKLEKLEELDLSLIFLDDISMLGKLKKLKHVILTGNDSINNQAKALKKSMPDCKFEIQ